QAGSRRNAQADTGTYAGANPCSGAGKERGREYGNRESGRYANYSRRTGGCSAGPYARSCRQAYRNTGAHTDSGTYARADSCAGARAEGPRNDGHGELISPRSSSVNPNGKLLR